MKDRIGWGLVLVSAFLLIRGGGVASVISGPRTVVIVHETAEATPAQSQMFVALRTGANEAYLKEKGHKLLILDDDALSADDKPLAILAKLNPLQSPPAVHVLSGDTVLTSKPLPATADGVMGILKGAGG